MEKIPELAGELVRVTRVTSPIAGADVAVKKNLLAMRTGIAPATVQSPLVAKPDLPLQTRAAVSIIEQSQVTWCKPWCESCGGWQGIERVYSDGSYTIRCLTCRAAMPDRPTERKPKVKNDQQTQEVDK